MSQTTREPSRASAGTLSVAKMLRLMGAEVENAQRHGYPVSCLMIEVDGLGGSADAELRAIVLPAVFQGLKVFSSRMQMRGLGLTKDPYLLALFPHVEPDRASELADELVRGARDLRMPSDPDLKLTLSIGVGHNMHPRAEGLVGMIEEAEVGLSLARDEGGDRFVQWKEVESEVDRMRAQIERELEALIHTNRERPKVDADAEQEVRRGQVLGKVVSLFKDEPRLSEGMIRLEQGVIDLLRGELDGWAKGFVERESQHLHRIDTLERRLAKLTKSLETTEEELKRVASMKAIDTGLSSIYRNVQGLSDDDDNAECKKAMLTNIFEANLALQR